MTRLADCYRRTIARSVNLLEDLARLPPLGVRHTNFLGRHAFALPAEPGELRPLRDPDAAEDEEEAA